MGFFDKWDEEDSHGDTPDGTPAPVIRTGETTAYGRKALDGELAKLAAATEGTRNHTLNEVAFSVAQLVNGGHVEKNEGETEVARVARSIRLTPLEIANTMKSAGQGAASKPRTNLPAPTAAPVTPKPTVLRSVPTGADVDNTPERDSSRDNDLWEARDTLRHIRDSSLAQSVVPWGALGVQLVRAACITNPTVVLPDIIGSHGSLNMFTALVGPSGAGKSGTLAAAGDALRFNDTNGVTNRTIERFPLGSGEGIAATYVETAPKNADNADDNGQIQVRIRALFLADEIDTMKALGDRNGSTLMGVLRSIYTGEQIGSQNADKARRRVVQRHTYRAGLVAGVQPARAAMILDDADGGTPQRFMWMPVTDPNFPHPNDRPEKPAPRTIVVPGAMCGDEGTQIMDVCQTAIDAIRESRYDAVRGLTPQLDGHALFQQLKVSAALAVLDRRLNVTDEDWQLAEIVMGVSNATRAHCVATLAARAADENEKKARAEGHRQATVDSITEDRSRERAQASILRRLEKLPEGEWVTHGRLRVDAVSGRSRGEFDPAMRDLIEGGKVAVDDDGKTARYRLAT